MGEAIRCNTTQLTEAEWAQFDAQGYLYLGQVASNAQLLRLQTRMNDIMLGKVRYTGMYFQLDSDTGAYGDVPSGGAWAVASLDYRKIEQLERDAEFLTYLQHPLFASICQRVYGESVSVYRSMFMNKPAQKGTVLPYHQDGGDQWGLDRNPLITLWTALDEATGANGCVEVVPGSHKLGLLSEWGHTITEEQEAEYATNDKGVFLTAKAGEVILLHNWLLHRSGVNSTNQPRRAFSVCYMEGATQSTRNANRAFPRVFGEGAMRPEDQHPDA
jgi:hypothetical protein